MFYHRVEAGVPMQGVTYREVETKSGMSSVKGMPFDWSLNPYRGCVHACTYCFRARVPRSIP